MPNRRTTIPDDYKLSRAAQRNLYGTRRIDASAPQAQADSTPSGRARRWAAQGMDKDQQRIYGNDLWRERFPAPKSYAPGKPLPAALTPTADTAKRYVNQAPARSMLDAINANAPDMVPLDDVAAPPASLFPDEPVLAMDDMSDLFPQRAYSPLSFFRQKQKPSILTGAQDWVMDV